MRFHSTVSIGALLLASCSTPSQRESIATSAPALPTNAELEGHVRQHWDGWGERFARFSGRRGEEVEFVGVSNASCSYTYDTPECWLEVTGRFASGAELQQRMFSQFERDEAGNLVEVIVMRHERRR